MCYLEERADEVRVLVGKGLGHRHNVERTDAGIALLLCGHDRRSDFAGCLGGRATKDAGHVDRTVGKRNSAVRRSLVDDGHGADIDIESRHLLAEREVGHGVQRNSRRSCPQLGSVGGVDTERVRDEAVIRLVDDGNADHLERRTLLDRCHKRCKALRVSDVDIACEHGFGHLHTGREIRPVDVDTHGVVIGLVDLRNLVRRCPLEEEGDIDRSAA